MKHIETLYFRRKNIVMKQRMADLKDFRTDREEILSKEQKVKHAKKS